MAKSPNLAKLFLGGKPFQLVRLVFGGGDICFEFRENS